MPVHELCQATSNHSLTPVVCHPPLVDIYEVLSTEVAIACGSCFHLSLRDVDNIEYEYASINHRQTW